MPDTTSLDTRVAVTNNVIEVTMGAARASVPVDQLDSLLRLLEGCRLIASASSSAGLAPSATTPALPAPAAAPSAPAAPVSRGPGRPRKDASAPQAARPTAAESTRAAKAGGGRKRRSRKRVGDALVGWMEANPGWHSEEHLLNIVIDNKMSDASPKRALKIALGKQRGDLFEGDGQGHWKLKSDTTAGGPPPRVPKEKKKPGRKPKALTQAAATAAEPKAQTPPVKVAPAKPQPKATKAKAEKPAEAKAMAPAPATEEAAPAPSETPAVAEEAKAGETKEATQKRKSLRVKKKSTVPPAAEAAEAEAEPEAEGDEGEEAEGGKEGPTSRLVRVKPGQDRKSASFAPGEKEAREEAAQRTGARKSARWNGVSTDEVERARRNLLGLGGGGAKPRGAVENDKA